MLRGDHRFIRTVPSFVVLFRPSAELCCLSALLLCGCAIFFGDKRSLVATVPAQSSSPASFKAVLTMSTRYIEFDGFQRRERNQRWRITVINRGRSGFEMKHANGKVAPITPGAHVDLYIGEMTNSTNSLRLDVTGVQRRTPCEFEVEAANPTQFRDAIRVYVFSSSAPM
jgi:hypothetical protein